MAELPTDTRNWAMFAHLSGALAQFLLPTMGFLGPLVILVVRQDDKVVQWHAYQALFFQLAMTIVAWVAGASCVLFFVVFFAWIAGIVVPILAAVKVNNNEPWEGYPLTGGMVPVPDQIAS